MTFLKPVLAFFGVIYNVRIGIKVKVCSIKRHDHLKKIFKFSYSRLFLFFCLHFAIEGSISLKGPFMIVPCEH